MAKRKISFKTTDGMKPRKLDAPGRPFGLRLPVDVNLPPRTKRTVRLGVTCEQPVLVAGTTGRASNIFSPGAELSVDLESMADPVNIGAGEVVAKAFVLDNSDNELAE